MPNLLNLLHHRFIKFGAVGASGMLVNLSVLWACREFIFGWVHLELLRMNLSLAFAIIVSTFSNYYWNRLWTWRDRRDRNDKGFWHQLLEYFIVCWAAIALQVLLTNLLMHVMHYLAANITAILFSAVVNFRANDTLTFSGRRPFSFRKQQFQFHEGQPHRVASK